MDADEVQAVAAATDGNLNILGALSSVLSPAPPRRASDASEDNNSATDGAADPSPSAPPAPGSSAGNSPSSGTTPATPSMIMTQQQHCTTKLRILLELQRNCTREFNLRVGFQPVIRR